MALKLKVRTQFPADVTAQSPIILTITGVRYDFSLDIAAITVIFGGIFQPIDDTLVALAALDATPGLLTQTGPDAFTKRTLTGTANEVTVTNGAGTAGNPTLSLPAALTFTGKTVTGGTFVGATFTNGTYDKVIITPPATSATLTLIDGTVLTGPAASGTVMTLGNTETVTGIKTFGSAGAVGRLKIAGSTSGAVTLDAQAVAGSNVLTLPVGTDTLVGKATTDVLTNKTFNSTGTGNVLQVSGVTVSAGQYPGEPTTGSATSGNVGEYIQSVVLTGSAVSLTSTVAKTVTSISLPAGDWDVSGNVSYNTAATTAVTNVGAYLSGTTNTIDVTPGKASLLYFGEIVPTSGLTYAIPVGPYRLSLAATTTVYLIALGTFTVSTLTAFGALHARRAR